MVAREPVVRGQRQRPVHHLFAVGEAVGGLAMRDAGGLAMPDAGGLAMPDAGGLAMRDAGGLAMR